MKIGLLKYNYNFPTYNVGDYIQSIAVMQFIKDDYILVDRESLKSYDGEELKIVLNGWYLHNIEEWPPSEKIHPLFVSFHLTTSAKGILDNHDTISYFRKYEPIGCRDYSTLNIFKSKNIRAYFSGCLTLTLGNIYKRDFISDEILFVDILPKIPSLFRLKTSLFSRCRAGKFFLAAKLVKYSLSNIIIYKERSVIYRKLFTSNLLQVRTEIIHDMYADDSEELRFKKADDLLKRYSKAKLVVTSKLHCALPCLAMGTPVIFVKGYDLSNDFDFIRLNDYLSELNMIEYFKDGTIKTNFSSVFEKIDLDFVIENGKKPNTEILTEVVSNYFKESNT